MIQIVKQIIFKLLLGKENYECLLQYFDELAKEYKKRYEEWTPTFENELNMNGICYKSAVKILYRM